jgi:hypothetical protein
MPCSLAIKAVKDEHMNEPEEKKYENKFLEVALMVGYFLIPFYGLQQPLRHYLEVEKLSAMYILLLVFVGGNIMTCMIFILNDRSVKTKALWTTGLVVLVAAINLLISLL